MTETANRTDERATPACDQEEGAAPLSIDDLSAFLAEFLRLFIAAGGQTVRVARSAQRLGLSFGVGVEMLMLSRHATITVTSLQDSSEYRTVVVPFQPPHFNLSVTFQLNRLSWDVFDDWLEAVGSPGPAKEKPGPGMADVMGHRVPEEVLRSGAVRCSRTSFERFRARLHDITRQPRQSEWVLCLMIGVASASFCRLSKGDWMAMAIVFFASQAAFLVRRFLVGGQGMDIRLGFLAASFTASFLSAVASWVVPSDTPEIAMAASILFLVPGIPLLSAVNDILHGHTLMGISRGMGAGILTLCIAFGLAITLMTTGFNVL